MVKPATEYSFIRIEFVMDGGWGLVVDAVVVVAFLRMQESGKSAMCKCLQPILAEVCKEKGAKLYRRFPKFRRHFDLKSSCH